MSEDGTLAWPHPWSPEDIEDVWRAVVRPAEGGKCRELRLALRSTVHNCSPLSGSRNVTSKLEPPTVFFYRSVYSNG